MHETNHLLLGGDMKSTCGQESLRRLLFPEPTSNNGWEVVCDVADRLQGDLLTFEELTVAKTMTLSAVSRYFMNREAQRLVTLLLETARLPFVSPRKEIDFKSTFPDFGAFRKIIRFLSIAMFHAAGTGRSRDTVKLFEAGIRISFAPAGEALIGTLVSIACQSTLLRRVVLLAPLLGPDDLDRLGATMQACVENRAGYIRSFEAEVGSYLRYIESISEENISEKLEPDADSQKIFDALARNNARLNAAKNEATDYARSELYRYVSILEHPYGWDNRRRTPAGDGARVLTEFMMSDKMRILFRILSIQTEHRMIALYCKAWAYRKRTLAWPLKLTDISPQHHCTELVSTAMLRLEVVPGADAIRIQSAGLPALDGETRQLIAVPQTPKSSS